MASEYTYDEEGETWPFFVMAVLTFILLPLTFRWVYRIFNEDNPITVNQKIKGSIVSEDVIIENRDAIHSYQRKQKSFKVLNKTLLAIIVGWFLVIYIGFVHTQEANLTGAFDPYTILDVSTFSSEKEIKSRYRKLSLKFHPDKLPKDMTDKLKEEMEASYIQMTLAYKALTDETTKENFLKYGHPDGPQEIKHGIAIPNFLVEGKYSPIMVIVYFLLIGGLLPAIVGLWWNNAKTHTRKGLHVDTAAVFTRKLTDKNPAKIVTPYDLLDWICLSNEIQTSFKHLPGPVIKDCIQRHLFRSFEPFPSNNVNLEQEKIKIISHLPKLISGLIDIATVFRHTDVLLAATDLQKCISQAVPPIGKYQDLLQLPYVDSQVVQGQPIKKLGKLFTLSKDEQKKVLGIKEDEKLSQALKIAERIPTLRILLAEFKVPGEEIIPPVASAHVSLKFLVKSPKHKSCPDIADDDRRLQTEETLEYLRNPIASVNDSQPSLPYTYAPYFPDSSRNHWTGFLISQKDNKIVEGMNAAYLENLDLSNLELTQEQYINGGEEVVIGKFNIPLTTPTPGASGEYHFRLILKNNGYFGCDVDVPIKMNVEVPVPKLFNNRKEKKKIMEVSGSSSEEDEDDESDISDPEEDSIAGALAAFRGGNVKLLDDKNNDDNDAESDTESIFTDINTDTEDEKE